MTGDETKPLTMPPYPVCGGVSFSWGRVSARNLAYHPGDMDWLARKLDAGSDLKARRCNSCRNIQLFTIAPQGWVTARHYNRQDLNERLEALLRARRNSLVWLKSLRHPDWSMARTHPAAGSMTAADVPAAWVAHDHLHLRRLNHLHWQYLETPVAPVSLDYAGGW